MINVNVKWTQKEGFTVYFKIEKKCFRRILCSIRFEKYVKL